MAKPSALTSGAISGVITAIFFFVILLTIKKAEERKQEMIASGNVSPADAFFKKESTLYVIPLLVLFVFGAIMEMRGLWQAKQIAESIEE